MAGKGPAPKLQRRNKSDKPARGEWTAAPGIGWQYGRRPAAPSGLLEASRQAWATWLGAWFAAHWTPADVPALRHLIRLYDATERGQLRFGGELRMWSDEFGISPKGQQDRRWAPPTAEDEWLVASDVLDRRPPTYAHLQVVDKGAEQ